MKNLGKLLTRIIVISIFSFALYLIFVLIPIYVKRIIIINALSNKNWLLKKPKKSFYGSKCLKRKNKIEQSFCILQLKEYKKNN